MDNILIICTVHKQLKGQYILPVFRFSTRETEQKKRMSNKVVEWQNKQTIQWANKWLNDAMKEQYDIEWYIEG